jgi:hypothetical protein
MNSRSVCNATKIDSRDGHANPGTDHC